MLLPIPPKTKNAIRVPLMHCWGLMYYEDPQRKGYAWRVLRKSIEKEGLRNPLCIIAINKSPDEFTTSAAQKVIAGYKYYIINGNHRAAVLKHLHPGDPLFMVNALVFDSIDEYTDYTTFKPMPHGIYE